MNIYKLTFKEVLALDKEFSKTGFGIRAKIFSLLPVISLLLIVVEVITNDGSDLSLGLVFLIFSFLGITQLQYGNMLKEYAQSKKDKE